MSDHAPILTETTKYRSPQEPPDSLTEAAHGGRDDPPGRINRSTCSSESERYALSSGWCRW
jgi:hypothetical protein